jgi:hypothetical protein
MANTDARAGGGMILAVVYKSTWWSVHLPEGWTDQTDDEGASFIAPADAGVLQISAARKELDSISDDELKKFAYQRIPPTALLEVTTAGTFTGFTATYTSDEELWQEWWARHQQLLIYATYINLATGDGKMADVLRILSSLAPSEHAN